MHHWIDFISQCWFIQEPYHCVLTGTWHYSFVVFFGNVNFLVIELLCKSNIRLAVAPLIDSNLFISHVSGTTPVALNVFKSLKLTVLYRSNLFSNLTTMVALNVCDLLKGHLWIILILFIQLPAIRKENLMKMWYLAFVISYLHLNCSSHKTCWVLLEHLFIHLSNDKWMKDPGLFWVRMANVYYSKTFIS